MVLDLIAEKLKINIDKPFTANTGANYILFSSGQLKKYDIKHGKYYDAPKDLEKLLSGRIYPIATLQINQKYYVLDLLRPNPIIERHWSASEEDLIYFERNLVFKTKLEARLKFELLQDVLRRSEMKK